MGPLAGIKIVEMAGIGPGPLCGMMLADMGAEVFLVERQSGKSAESSLHVRKRDMMRRGKLPVAVDLKDPAGIQQVLDLVEQADALIEAFRPGVMERLGLGPDICLARNPALVYGRLTGWGQTGPLSQVAGHDPNYISLTGALYHSGNGDRPPQAPPTLLGDAMGGTAMMAWGLACGLLHASRTGEGQVIDAAIVDGTAYLASFARSFYQGGHLSDERGGQWMDGAAPWNRTYVCSDGGYVTVCAVEAKFYRVLLQLLELEAVPEFVGLDQWDRSRWPEQVGKLQAMFLSRTRDDWCELLEGTDACFAPVLNYSEAPHHPHNRARDAYREVDGEWYPQPAPRFSATIPEPTWEDTESPEPVA